ncbi:MAG TPA: STAS domain-containing protein [Azospirillum sp.]|nr:STAS domain-containing protein [Azospirillum sp.]
MDYTVRDRDGVREVFLRGQLTFDADEDFRKIIGGMETDRVGACVLDMGGLDFIDSAGLGLLVLATNTANRCQVPLKMRGPRGQVRDMIEISEFHTLIPCEF